MDTVVLEYGLAQPEAADELAVRTGSGGPGVTCPDPQEIGVIFDWRGRRSGGEMAPFITTPFLLTSTQCPSE